MEHFHLLFMLLKDIGDFKLQIFILSWGKSNSDKEKEELKLSAFANNSVLCINDSKGSTKQLLELITNFRNVVECRIDTQKSLALVYPNNEQDEKEI